MYKIFIIEDDAVIAGAMETYLKNWDYNVKCAKEFKDIMPEFNEFEPEIVLIDISLPFMNGYHWCKCIRKTSKVPIIFISSTSDDMNIVMAMDIGADDFISKPFNLNVLSAKIGAIIRRTYSFGSTPNIINYKNLEINLSNSTLIYEGTEICLTKNDFKILQILVENNGKIVSRDDIMIHLWNSERFIDDNTLTVNIARLRKKLAEIGLDDFIVTKKNMGYMV